ncbi:MAG: M20 family metallopeptidase [Candidatus Heimdallarchaeota archaeon]|nr:M20 family metallopeptidase [Candidatus Heimdallarchaeota archaeon]
MKDEIEKLVQDLVQIDSTDGKSLSTAIKYKEFLDSHGLSSDIDEYEDGTANVYSSIGLKGGPKIVLSGHLDTVPIGVREKWKHDPFSGKIINNELWGRGSVDMKGGTGCIAGVLVELLKHESELQCEIVVAASGEEEIALSGASKFAADGVMKNSSHLLIAEPTGLKIGIMHKGVIWLDINAQGKSAHGAYPHLGRNAIEGLANVIPKLYSALPDLELPEVGKTTLNVGVISGGTKPNVVAESSTVIIDIRITPGIDPDNILKDITEILDSNSDETLKLSLQIRNKYPPVLSKNNDFGDTINGILKDYKGELQQFGGLRYATDASVLFNENPCSLVIFGPGSEDLLHQTDERLDLTQLDIARKVIKDSILQINNKIV